MNLSGSTSPRLTHSTSGRLSKQVSQSELSQAESHSSSFEPGSFKASTGVSCAHNTRGYGMIGAASVLGEGVRMGDLKNYQAQRAELTMPDPALDLPLQDSLSQAQSDDQAQRAELTMPDPALDLPLQDSLSQAQSDDSHLTHNEPEAPKTFAQRRKDEEKRYSHFKSQYEKAQFTAARATTGINIERPHTSSPHIVNPHAQATPAYRQELDRQARQEKLQPVQEAGKKFLEGEFKSLDEVPSVYKMAIGNTLEDLKALSKCKTKDELQSHERAQRISTLAELKCREDTRPKTEADRDLRSPTPSSAAVTASFIKGMVEAIEVFEKQHTAVTQRHHTPSDKSQWAAQMLGQDPDWDDADRSKVDAAQLDSTHADDAQPVTPEPSSDNTARLLKWLSRLTESERDRLKQLAAA